MVRRVASRTLRTFLSLLPGQTRRDLFRVVYRHTDPGYRQSFEFATAEGALTNAKDNGFRPSAIIDVGAHIGDWSRMARRIFPNPPIFMLDANPENELSLLHAAGELGGKHSIHCLGAEAKNTVTFYQLSTGSSVLPELTGITANSIEIPMTTLDTVLQTENLAAPLLLKLDVQGFELEVLRGGRKTMEQAELILLELATLPYNEGAPLFAEVIAFMDQAGFAVYDFGGQFRRQSDQALFQIDVLFARKESQLRGSRKFWSEPEKEV